MAATKYDTRFLHSTRNPYAIFNRCRKRFLAENMVPLSCERLHDLSVHVILHCDYDRVGEPCPNRLYSLRRGSEEFLPCSKHEAAVDLILFDDELARLRARFDRCYNFAFVRSNESILCVSLERW